MKITQVERQKKNPKRFNVYLDGVFSFGADEDLIVDRRLLVGKEIDAEDLEKIIFGAEVGKLMERMYLLFNIRQRSEKEIRDYLRNLSFKRKIKDQDPVPEVAIEQLIENLKRKGMLNDLQFAKAWVESRAKKKGINIIKYKFLLFHNCQFHRFFINMDKAAIFPFIKRHGAKGEGRMAKNGNRKFFLKYCVKTIFNRKYANGAN